MINSKRLSNVIKKGGYKFKIIVGKSNFSDQFKKNIIMGYNMNIMRQSTCLMVNPITVYGYRFLFNCTAMCQASDLMTALTYSLNPLVGA